MVDVSRSFFCLPQLRFVDSKSTHILDLLQNRADFFRQEGYVLDVRVRRVLELKGLNLH